MGLFSSEAERTRKQNLKELEDKRLRFAAQFSKAGYRPLRTLYAQYEGGFTAISQLKDGFLLLTGPAPGSQADFTMECFDSLSARVEDVRIKSEGLGGLLGFGKKGGHGFRLIVQKPTGEEFMVELTSGLGTYLEVVGDRDPLFKEKRRRGDANFVWDFRPVERDVLDNLKQAWLTILNG